MRECHSDFGKSSHVAKLTYARLHRGPGNETSGSLAPEIIEACEN